jgi:hypothetical protein
MRGVSGGGKVRPNSAAKEVIGVRLGERAIKTLTFCLRSGNRLCGDKSGANAIVKYQYLNVAGPWLAWTQNRLQRWCSAFKQSYSKPRIQLLCKGTARYAGQCGFDCHGQDKAQDSHFVVGAK